MSRQDYYPEADVFVVLKEAALANQRAISDMIPRLSQALATLEQTSGNLPRQVAKETASQIESMLHNSSVAAADVVFRRFNDANEQAEKTREAYKQAADLVAQTGIRFSLYVFGAGFLSILAGIIISTIFILPNPSKLQSYYRQISLLKSQKQVLEGNLERLKRDGAMAETVKCIIGGHDRLCIRVNESAGGLTKFTSEPGNWAVVYGP